MIRYYNILGVTPEDSIKDVKKAYREKVKILHPDINHAPNAHEKFVELQEAFNWILRYDKLRKKQIARQQHNGAQKQYQAGTFDSFYYRQYSYQNRKAGARKKLKIPSIVYWIFHTLYFLLGMAILINSISSFIHFLVPRHLTTAEYIVMLVFTMILGLVFTGVSLISAYNLRSTRSAHKKH